MNLTKEQEELIRKAFFDAVAQFDKEFLIRAFCGPAEYDWRTDEGIGGA